MFQTETELGLALFQLDLNADLGEWTGGWEAAVDAALLKLVSSASIACGGHAGNADTMRRTAAEAVRLGVTIGAHPGYADREGFGRRELDLPVATIAGQLTDQVEGLIRWASAEGARVRYVKPHGALYNRAARDAEVAAAIAVAVRGIDPGLSLLGLAGSALVSAAGDCGVRAVSEAFLDRGYAADGSLIPRGAPGAVLDDAEAVAERAVVLAREGVIEARDGTRLSIPAESCCVHGDSAGAVRLLGAARSALERAGVRIAPFAA
jgi:UPF0271 protein